MARPSRSVPRSCLPSPGSPWQPRGRRIDLPPIVPEPLEGLEPVWSALGPTLGIELRLCRLQFHLIQEASLPRMEICRQAAPQGSGRTKAETHDQSSRRQAESEHEGTPLVYSSIHYLPRRSVVSPPIQATIRWRRGAPPIRSLKPEQWSDTPKILPVCRRFAEAMKTSTPAETTAFATKSHALWRRRHVLGRQNCQQSTNDDPTAVRNAKSQKCFWRGGPMQVARIRLATAVDVTPLFSLRENAIAKEPGSSYLERWRCVSRLGASMVA